MIKKILVSVIASTIPCAYATLYEVVDQQVLAQVKDQVAWAEDQYLKLEQQMTQLEDTHTALTEIEDFSDAFTFVRDVYGQYDEDFWDWTPSLEELEAMSAGGYDQRSVNDRIAYYNQQYGHAKNPAYFSADPDNTNAVLKSDVSKSSRYTLGLSHEAFNKAEDFQQHYQQLLNEFNHLDSQKKSTDFGNHQLLQLTQMMNEVIKLQALQLYLLAQDKKELDGVNEFNATFINSAFPTKTP